VGLWVRLFCRGAINFAGGGGNTFPVWACFEGTNEEFHLNSSLLIVRCGLNFSERLQRNVPDVSYFVWEGDPFRKILFISGKQTQTLK
jgi:hypothetical protein